MRYCSAAKRKRHSIHARIRGLERIGIRIGPKRQEQLINHIINRKAVFLKRTSGGLARYRVSLWGEDMVVVFSRNQRRVVTVWRYEDAGE